MNGSFSNFNPTSGMQNPPPTFVFNYPPPGFAQPWSPVPQPPYNYRMHPPPPLPLPSQPLTLHLPSQPLTLPPPSRPLTLPPPSQPLTLPPPSQPLSLPPPSQQLVPCFTGGPVHFPQNVQYSGYNPLLPPPFASPPGRPGPDQNWRPNFRPVNGNRFSNPEFRANTPGNVNIRPFRGQRTGSSPAPRFSSNFSGSPAQPSNKRFGENSNNQKNAKKQKVDKRDLPENNVFVCEACDRGFKFKEQFDEHVASHEKCHVAGCQYVAHPKLVRMHFECQHRTGLAKKIWQLQTPEEIEKWKNERKRNFPTAENIIRKKAEQMERRNRGEVCKNKYFGKMANRQNRDRDSDFKSTGDVKDKNTDVKSTEDSKENNIAVEHEKSVDTGVDSDGIENEAPLDMKNTPSRDDNRQLEQQSSSVGHSKERRTKRNLKKNRKHPKFDSIQLMKNPKRSSLLEKLLAKEIRHERNVILQCVRYIVQNFDLADERDVTCNSKETKKNFEEETTNGEKTNGEKQTKSGENGDEGRRTYDDDERINGGQDREGETATGDVGDVGGVKGDVETDVNIRSV